MVIGWLTAFALVVSAAGVDAPQAVPASVDAQAVLARALSQASGTHIAPFLRYRYAIAITHKSRTKDYSYVVLERMADHYGRFTGLNHDGTESQDVHLHKTFVSPGLFLNALADDASADAASAGAGDLQPIGRVFTVPYTASLQGEEPAADCSHAYHLALTPKRDADRHALRELWVDTETSRICRAKLAMTVNIISRERVAVDVDLDGRQFVSRCSLDGKGHTLLGTYALEASGRFTDVANVPAADDKLFPLTAETRTLCRARLPCR